MRTFQHFATAAILLGLAAAVPVHSFAQVNVTNPDSQPVPIRDVDPPGRTPLQVQFDVNMPPGQTTADSVDTGQSAFVAAGRLFVVEQVAFQGACYGGASPNVAFGVRVHAPSMPVPSLQDAKVYAGRATGGFSFSANPGADSSAVYGFGPTRVYLPAGSTLYGFALRDGNLGQCIGTVTASGYIRQVPLDVIIKPRH